jgi:hypothetical protein
MHFGRPGPGAALDVGRPLDGRAPACFDAVPANVCGRQKRAAPLPFLRERAMRSGSELELTRRQRRVGVASFFLSVAGLAGVAMLVVLTVLQAPRGSGNETTAANGEQAAEEMKGLRSTLP